MVARLLGLLVVLAGLALLFYLQQVSGTRSQDNGGSVTPGTEPGYSATHAQLIQTGDNGAPLYQLDADRIDQQIPGPEGDVVLTEPRLHYQPVGGNSWDLAARHGVLPPGAQHAQLSGAVQVSGRPEGSDAIMHIHTERLNLDLTREIATSPVRVSINWGQARLTGTGLYVDLKGDTLRLQSAVHGSLAR